MLCEGLGVRATSRLSGVDQKTVLNILRTAGIACARLQDKLARNLKPEPIEIDECWTMVCNKRALINNESRGDFYAFLASGMESKLVCSFAVGKRNDETAQGFVRDLAKRITGNFQVTSDGWVGFIRGILDNAFERAQYAVQYKKYEGYNFSAKGSKRRYSPGKCVSVTTTHICGSPKREDICTSHAERLNLSLRHFNKRFTRLSPCFSKKLENLELSVALTVGYFNFCRTHSSLKIKATETEKAMERTPAQAAGIATHCWTVAELLGAETI